MELQFLYPENKTKAITFSYDDGQVYDRKLVDIFNRYGMKGTFHLNSGMLDKDNFVTGKEIKELYKGHEIACHGVKHEYLNHLPKELLVYELWEDRKRLEELSERIVLGMSYAYGEYCDEVVNCLRQTGIKYSRTVESTKRFEVPADFLRWKPTCHHNDNIITKAKNFLNPPGYMKLPLFYIWGHSFEFERENTWHIMDELCKMVANKDDIWYVTNIDYYNYITAMKSLIFSVNRDYVYNPSSSAVWFKLEDEVIAVQPGETRKLDK